ncbi:sortase [Micromonospora narathiwatensis]|uniref:LPXTG-site transpeptidase (Sortase) family protein n=1 Tax=Micromonospora narathiwatensis TaxID=299146 RepID=A0A1A9ACH8_9ACTN|nr:sortase [Micromonospora narathiwatensis]SBT53904.1 LPXTG-site transpeptidase (sortase) family protein [Micromonospora narathiwatensis]
MTVTTSRPPAAPPPAPAATAPAPPPAAASRPLPAVTASPPESGASSPAHLAFHLSGAGLTILAVVLLAFVAHLTVVSQLRYARSQQTAYADFRYELANATAPVGQTDENGKLVPPGSAVAVLRIPAIDLRTVVFEGTRGDVLESGPGHRRDTVLPGQAGTSIVMGRKFLYGGPFGALDVLTTGDEITAITGQGEHKYRVIALRRAGEEAPPPSETAPGRLVLITADGPVYAPEDLLYVYAELTSDAQPAARRAFGAASLPASERPMAADQNAWMSVVLWGQALLLAVAAVTWVRVRRGRWPAWIVGLPVCGALGLTLADQVARLLPNLM